jgi:predicted HicB family RNase H-like nuclease
MSMTLKYKGYTAQVEIDGDLEILFGRVIDIAHVITFQGATVPEVRQAFHDSVDDYLAFCREIGEQPDKAYSGKLPFRTTPANHRKIVLAAKAQGKSVNRWMIDILVQAAELTAEQAHQLKELRELVSFYREWENKVRKELDYVRGMVQEYDNFLTEKGLYMEWWSYYSERFPEQVKAEQFPARVDREQ